jgi:hypothetical protein
MAEFYGSGAYFVFNGTAGTANQIDMSEYQRSITFSPAADMAVVTTGAATAETRMVGLKDFTVTYKGLMQAGTGVATAAMQLENQLAWGKTGTIKFSPELAGTGSGYRLYTLPVISQGLQQNWQYDSVVELSVDFVGNGTITYGTVV